MDKLKYPKPNNPYAKQPVYVVNSQPAQDKIMEMQNTFNQMNQPNYQPNLYQQNINYPLNKNNNGY